MHSDKSICGILLPGSYISNPFIFSPFWILFGITTIVVGNELMGKIEREQKYSSIVNYSAMGTGIFLFLVVIARLIMGKYQGETLYLNYISDLCWRGVGAYLMSIRFVN